MRFSLRTMMSGGQIEQALETVVTVDHAAIQIV
jgi:hypothetical protein